MYPSTALDIRIRVPFGGATGRTIQHRQGDVHDDNDERSAVQFVVIWSGESKAKPIEIEVNQNGFVIEKVGPPAAF